MSHTVLLVQTNSRLDTRTWVDFETVGECMEGICKIFEEHLKKQNPRSERFTYDVSELFDFIDQLTDMSCFVCQKNNMAYVPRNKEWIKQQIYMLLRKQAVS